MDTNNKKNILAKLDYFAALQPDRSIYTFLNDQGLENMTLSFEELRLKATEKAHLLLDKGYIRGDRVVLSVTKNYDFILWFLGCLYAGLIAVPLPPPSGKRQLARLKNIIGDSDPKAIVTDSKFKEIYQQLVSADTISSDMSHPVSNLGLHNEEICPQDVAFIQYTSGSTGSPKGVVVTHENIFENEIIIQKSFGHDREAVIVGWLPFHHDMGLIGNILQPLFVGAHCILLSPICFLRRPQIWLQAISKYRATTSGGPNFAFNYCISKISDADMVDADLRSWKLAFNGSEMVKRRTIDLFAKKFEKFGFDKKAFYPCYGLAESTLFVSGNYYAEQLTHEEVHKTNVSCGSQDLDNICIVDPNSLQKSPPGEIGEIWLKGKSVCDGYWKNPELTKDTFHAYTKCGEGPYLRTGDIGYLKGGSFFVNGRIKEMVVHRGENFYLSDIDEVLNFTSKLVRQICCSVYSSNKNNQDELTVLIELPKNEVDLDSLSEEFVSSLSESFGLSVTTLAFFSRNQFPRTTSGKIQHNLCRERFQNADLSPLWVKRYRKGVDETTSANLGEFCQNLFGISTIDFRKPLIEYGIDSLKIVELVHFIEDSYSCNLSFSDFSDSLTLDDLYTLIDREPRKNIEDGSFGGSEKSFDLTGSQRNIWLHQVVHPRDTSYNIPILLKVKHNMSFQRFRKYLESVLNRYKSLRLKISSASGRQSISNSRINLEEISLDENNDADLAALFKGESSVAFDLDHGPLFRGKIIRTGESNCYLLFTFHHLACDGWSLRIFAEDLENACSEIELKSEKEFFASQYFFHSEVEKKAAQRYWTKKLRTGGNKIDLSYLVKNKQDGLSSKDLFFHADTSQIENLCVKHQLTPASLFLGIFHSVIYNYWREKNIYIGYASANRGRSKSARSFGCFVNTLVSSSKLDLTSSILDICKSVRKEIKENSNYEFYPFTSVLEDLSPQRQPGISPIFQFYFVMQSAPSSVSSDVVSIEYIPNTSSQPIYELVLDVAPGRDAYRVQFEFKEDRIPDFVARDILDLFQKALNKLNVEEKTTIVDILPKPTIKEEVKHEEFSFLSSFELVVKNNPSKTAVVGNNQEVSYLRLWEMSNAFAALLQKNGTGQGSVVLIPGIRSIEYISAVLAVQICGACYFTVDPEMSDNQLCWAIAELNPVLQLSWSKDSINCEVPVLKIDLGAFDTHKPISYQVDQSNTAYIIATSGSTGRPKLVDVSYGSLYSFITSATDIFETCSSDRYLQFCALHWDTSSEEIYPILASGGTLVLRSQNSLEAFSDLIALTEKEKVTCWNLPTSYWSEFLRFCVSGKNNIPSSLKQIIIGGEPVSLTDIQHWQRNFKTDIKLLNTYGATELTSISLYADLAKFDPNEIKLVPAGRTISRTKAFILDEDLMLVPPGSVGKLYISGPGLANGYIGNQDETKRRFFFHDGIGERIYDTGDNACKDDKGNVYIVGRNSRIIKRRGVRIDTSFFDEPLSKIDNVISWILHPNGDKVNLYVYAGNQNLAKVQDSIKEAFGTMPSHYLPDSILFVRKIPRLSNGKIDRDRIAEQVVHTTKDKKIVSSKNTLNKTEIAIQNVWKKILQNDQIGLHTSFFDAGGNSLMILTLKDQLEQTFNHKIEVAILFTHSTITSQAKLLGEDMNTYSEFDESDDISALLSSLERGETGLDHVKERLGV